MQETHARKTACWQEGNGLSRRERALPVCSFDGARAMRYRLFPARPAPPPTGTKDMPMKKLNPEHIAAIVSLVNKAPFLHLLSIEVVELGPGLCRARAVIDEKHHNPFGGLHGGVYASLIDTVAYWAVYCDLPEGAGMTTLDLTVTNLAPAKKGVLTVDARRIKAGRTIGLAEASVTDEKGKLLAHGISKMMILEGVQPVRQAVEAMGHPPLPPKFLGK